MKNDKCAGEVDMTTIPNSKDNMLYNLVRSVVEHNGAVDVHAIKTMLAEGANPEALVDHGLSAYSLLVMKNVGGQYNSILEEFDDFLDKKHLREHDSTYEGMEGKLEE